MAAAAAVALCAAACTLAARSALHPATTLPELGPTGPCASRHDTTFPAARRLLYTPPKPPPAAARRRLLWPARTSTSHALPLQPRVREALALIPRTVLAAGEIPPAGRRS